MTIATVIAGGWYTDSLPNGAYVDLIAGSHLDTSRGGVALPNGTNVLQLALAADGVRFAGTAHEGPLRDHAVEWDGVEWHDRGIAHGLNACIYNRADILIVARPGPDNTTGALGFRQVADDGALVSCEASYVDPVRRVWEYTTRGDLIVGQGGSGVHGEDPVIALYRGRRILIAAGLNRFIRFRRADVAGVDTLSLAWVQSGAAARLTMPVAELLNWPLARDLDTPPVVVVPPVIPPTVPIPPIPPTVPVPPKTPKPTPTPTPTPEPPSPLEVFMLPDYGQFVTVESWAVEAAYKRRTGHAPAISDQYHNAFRRLAEHWTHRDIIHDILGEPLEDGGAGGETVVTVNPR